jgi:hypothetical protein
MAGLLLLILFTAIVVCGSTYFALRDPPPTSRMKIAFTCVLLFGFLLALAGSRWIVGEEDLSGATLLIWPMAATGIVFCLSSVIGTLIGTKWRTNRS